MKRSTFLTLLFGSSLFGILGCSLVAIETENQTGMSTQGKTKGISTQGKTKATVKVTYKVIDKDGNAKHEGTSETTTDKKE